MTGVRASTLMSLVGALRSSSTRAADRPHRRPSTVMIAMVTSGVALMGTGIGLEVFEQEVRLATADLLSIATPQELRFQANINSQQTGNGHFR